MSVKIASNMADIKIAYLLNTVLEFYHFADKEEGDSLHSRGL
jgi:hypothetical protein